MDEVVREFLLWAEAEAGLSANTLAAYRRDLACYGRFLARRGVSAARIRPPDIVAFLASQRRAGRAESTVARRFACLRSFHRFGHAEGLLARDPAMVLDSPRRWRTLPRVPTVEEMDRLLTGISDDSARGRRDLALFETLYATGARVGEILGARIQDYQPDLKVLRVTGKGSKERIVPLGGRAREALAGHLADRPGAGAEAPLIASLRGRRLTRDRVLRLLRVYARDAGLKRTPSPHSFRHAFATHLLEGDADIRAVQELLGHANVTTTQIYTHVEQDRLRSIHARYHPRA